MLAMVAYLNVKIQKLIQQVAETEGKKQKKPQSVSVKRSVELYEKYFAQMDAGVVQEIMEKALDGYLGKEAASVQQKRSEMSGSVVF